jgi:PIN domain nuclease of toxin-antitoxin system
MSVASAWEIGIKTSLSKLDIAEPVDLFIRTLLDGLGMQLLGIDLRHVAVMQTLPFHHRDPFDRMIVAQALTENCALASNDTIFDTYGITRIT